MGNFYRRRQGTALDGLKVWPDRSPLCALATKACESRQQKALREEGGWCQAGRTISSPSRAPDDEYVASGRAGVNIAASAAVHAGVPETDGFLFQSRFTGDACVAVFDRAFGKLRIAETPGCPQRTGGKGT